MTSLHLFVTQLLCFSHQQLHTEMKASLESKIASMEALIQEKTTSGERAKSELDNTIHKMQLLESRLTEAQSELINSNRKYTDLHETFVQKVSNTVISL